MDRRCITTSETEFTRLGAAQKVGLPRRALFVANTRSRRGAEGEVVAAKALEDGGIELVRGSAARQKACAMPFARRPPPFDMVILGGGGGDGTMNAAAPALLEAGVPLGILPLGTANDLARTLGIPIKLEQAAPDRYRRG